MSKDKHTNKSTYKKVFDLSLIVGAIVVLAFLVTYTVQLNTGIAKEIKGPKYSLRIEILNAGAENGLENRLRDYLNNIDSPDLELEIVKASRFTTQPSKETFIINRIKDSEGVIALSKILGIEKDKIQYSQLQHNKYHLHATIVIGTDDIVRKLLEEPEELE